jgi:hypothetical protein
MQPRTLTVGIDRKPQAVYQFVVNPENLPRWATSFCLSARRDGGDWIVETSRGPIRFHFGPPNDLGVLDHYIRLAPGHEICIPMRVVPMGQGSAVLFTLFPWSDMSDDQYATDLAVVERDLANLKQLLEKR